MKVVIVGAGIGGLICAIACRRENLEVVVVERTPALAPIGAGIQIPPNAARVARQLGLWPQLAQRGVVLDAIQYTRYSNGKLLFKIDGGREMLEAFGESWLVISRPDYHDVLWNAAKEAGVDLRLGCEVEGIDFDRSTVQIVGGERVEADIIVGADGLWSISRNLLLGRDARPQETGDLAYRATISLDQLKAFHDPAIEELIKKKAATCWMGPGSHCVMYPLAGGSQFNLVLVGPDDLEKNARQADGDLNEMRASFKGWDARLTKMISCIPSVLKWKLCHHNELETWAKNNVALLGDACHPTLPYQAQGAAMAAEDGAVLGKLLGLLERSTVFAGDKTELVPHVLKLYETLRKERTTLNVQGATANRYSYHLPDGQLQESRDAWLLSKTDSATASEHKFADKAYLQAILGFDSVADCVEAFGKWESAHVQGRTEKL